MARVSTTEGGYGGGASVIHSDASHSEYINVPDAELLFRGEYHRAGPDLVLTGHDGRHHIIPGYFASEHHAALLAPNGAGLSPEMVDLLAGSPAPGQYAQAQPTAAPDAIGKVEKVVGEVTVVRNGVSVALYVGDAVFKSDVIVTGTDSSAGITFPDGTVLDLVANTRMALNEYAYDPNGSNNGALFTLVEGTFGFVAGQVAHGNHMSVVTPVATMGIRGTAGIVRHEFRANAGDLIYSFLVLDEMEIRHHNQHHVGAYELRDNRPDSPTFGEIIQLIMDSGYVTYVEPQGPGLPPIVTTEPITDSRASEDRPLLHDMVDSYGQFTNPGGLHSPGSGDNPILLFAPQFSPGGNGQPGPINAPPPGSGGIPPLIVPIFVPNTPPPNPGPTNTAPTGPFIWTSPTSGPWETGPDWNQGVPQGPNTTVEIFERVPGQQLTVTYNATVTISELIIGPGATLDITGGSLTILNGVVDNGNLIVNGDPPTFTVTGPLTIASGKSFDLTDGTVNLVDVLLTNNGTITVGQDGVVNVTNLQHGSVNHGLVEATGGGQIIIVNNNNGGTSSAGASGQGGNQGTMEANGKGSLFSIANNNGGSLDNIGNLYALAGGHFVLTGGLTNHDVNDATAQFVAPGPDVGAQVVASGRGSLVSLTDGFIDNSGFMAALNHGTMQIENVLFENETSGVILAADGGRIFVSGTQQGSFNDGLIEAVDAGKITLDVGGHGGGGQTIEQGHGGGNFGTIEAVGLHSRVHIIANGGTFDNSDDNGDGGQVLAELGGRVRFDGNIDNHAGGTILSIDCDSHIVFANGFLDNAALIAAKDDGIIKLLSEQVTNEVGAKILSDDGTMRFEGGGVQNGGKIVAKDFGLIVFKSIGDGFDGNPIDVTNSLTDQNGDTIGGKIVAKDYGVIKFVGDQHAGVVDNDFGVINATHHGTIVFDDLALNNSSGGVVEATHEGTVIIEGDGSNQVPAVTDGNGTIAAIDWGSKVEILHGATIAGDVNNPDNGTFSPAPATLKADGGFLFVSSDSHLQDTVNVEISDHGIADFANVINANATVTADFSGHGTFELDKAPSSEAPRVTINDFGVGDNLDLTNLKFSHRPSVEVVTAEVNSGTVVTLEVTDGHITEDFTLTGGSYSTSDFTAISDPFGDTDIVFGTVDNWTSRHSGFWSGDDGGNWSQGLPTDLSTAEIEYSDVTTSGTVVVHLEEKREVGNLLIGQHGELDIINGGSLTVVNALDVSGQVIVDSEGEDPSLTVNGPVRVDSGASIQAQGSAASIEFFHDEVGNAGEILAENGGHVTLESLVWNEGGTISADSGGIVTISDSTVTNQFDSTISATGLGSEVDVSGSTISNDGVMGAAFGGVFDISHSTITQGGEGQILAFFGTVELSDATIQGGRLETADPFAGDGGIIKVVAADGANTTVFDGTNDHPVTVNGFVQVEAGANLELMGNIALGNGETNGTIDVDSPAAVGANLVIDGQVHLYGSGAVTLDGNSDAIIGAACDGGTLYNAASIIGVGQIGDGSTDLTLINQEGGVITATGGAAGPLVIDTGGNTVVNHGLMQATGGSELDIHSDLLNTGTLAADNGLVNVAGAVFGTGTDTVSNGGTLEFQSFVSAGQTVTFADPGTVAVGDAADFHAGISGFGLGDTLDLTNVAFSAGEQAVWTQVTTAGGGAGTLQIFGANGTLEDTLNLNGIYTQNEFALAQDHTAALGTDVEFQSASFISFNNGQINFTDNLGVGYAGPQISNGGSALTLTDGNLGEYGSWFANSKVSVDTFTASFDYHANGQADGIAFVLQDDARGTQAIGTDFADNGGSGLGYAGISPSVAIELNIYGGHTQGTNFAENGGTQNYNSTLPVDFWDTGDTVQVVLSYNGSVLNENLTDLVTGATYSANYTEDLASILSSNTAYVGFTGGTGGAVSIQTVSNFTFEAPAHWVGASALDPNGDWATASNWTDGNGNALPTAPNETNDVFVDASGAYTLTITDTETANSLTITSAGAGADVQDQAGGSLTLNGALTIDAGSFSLIGGDLSAAAINVGSAGHFIGEGTVSAPLDNDGGFVEALGNLSLSGPVTGAGTFQIDNGNTLEFGSSVAGGTVNFGGTSGTLQIDKPASFGAEINMAHADPSEVLDLGGFNSADTTATTGAGSFNGTTTTLTIHDSSDNETVTLNLVGDFSGASWNVTTDGHGGADVSDPPATHPPGVPWAIAYSGANTNAGLNLGSDQINLPQGHAATAGPTGAVTLGGPGNDNFVFHPGIGAGANSNASSDTIEFDNSANVHAVQQLAALITPDAQCSGWVEPGHNAGDVLVVPSQGALQAHLQSLAHLH